MVTQTAGKNGVKDSAVLPGGVKIRKTESGFHFDGNNKCILLDKDEHEISRLLAKISINTCVNISGSKVMINSHPVSKKPNLRVYAREGAGTKKHIWPFYGVITPWKNRIWSHTILLRGRPFCVVLCAAGIFCMPLVLDGKFDMEIAKYHTEGIFEHFKKAGQDFPVQLRCYVPAKGFKL